MLNGFADQAMPVPGGNGLFAVGRGNVLCGFSRVCVVSYCVVDDDAVIVRCVGWGRAWFGWCVFGVSDGAVFRGLVFFCGAIFLDFGSDLELV